MKRWKNVGIVKYGDRRTDFFPRFPEGVKGTERARPCSGASRKLQEGPIYMRDKLIYSSYPISFHATEVGRVLHCVSFQIAIAFAESLLSKIWLRYNWSLLVCSKGGNKDLSKNSFSNPFTIERIMELSDCKTFRPASSNV